MFPASALQTSIVYLILIGVDYTIWKDREMLAAALRSVYTAARAEAAAQTLGDFERGAQGVATRR